MRNTHLLVAAAVAGVLALAPGARAGLLGGMGGGLGGGIGGSVGGGLGGLSGGVGGGLGGDIRLGPGQTIDPVTGRVVTSPARIRHATTVVRHVDTVNVTATAIRAPAVPVVLAPRPIIAPVGDIEVIRRRQAEALVAGGVAVLPAPDAYVYMDRQADDLRRELNGTGVGVLREGDAIVLELPSDVTFAFDKSDVRERFYPVLDVVASTLNRYPATYVDVIGHTDAIGSLAYNQALSERRAASVAGFIAAREAIPARLNVSGRGKLEPIASNATIEGRAANRRVEILLHPFTAG